MFRAAFGIVVVALILLAGFGAARAAITRPNVLDRRVTAISAQAVMQNPAIKLVDAERQAAA
ncbi:MAG: hypothetical protein JO263_06625, partial [Candidatus Eremiobacteraeota bacterium]|nr:hypothetical protein [Candidatus Eremiobacteraeota bacterium]